LIFGILRPLSGIFSHDTYPAFLRSTWPLDGERNGGSKKIRGAHQTPSGEKSQTRRTKNRWPHQTATMKKSQGCSSFSR
jgi:hypothetical protein